MRLEAEQVTKQYQTDPKKHGSLMPFPEPIWWWRAENLPSLQEIGKREIHAPPYPCRAASADIGLRAGGRERFVPYGGR